MTALDALGYAGREPAAKGGPVLYRAAFIVVFTLLTIIRLVFRVTTGTFRERLYADRKEWRFIALRGVFGIPLVVATAVFVFRLRWAPSSFVALALVTTGPYRFVRHPMYPACLLLFLGAFLLSANWAIVRLADEEQRLAQRFGERWFAYREVTRAFLPRLRRRTPAWALRAAAGGGGR